jgi:O-antigen/teichoic acid export membrane protein
MSGKQAVSSSTFADETDPGPAQATSTASSSKSLAVGSSIYLVSNILNGLVPFALLPVLTRYLTPAEYGEVAMFQTWIAALAAFTGLSVHGAAERKYYDTGSDENALRCFIGACLQVLVLSTLVTFCIVCLFRTQLAELLGLQTQWLLWGVGVSTAGFLVQIRLGQWLVRKKALAYGALQISLSLMLTLLSILTVVVLLWAAEGRILAQIWTAAAFMGISLYFLHADRLIAFNTEWSRIREALAFGVPLIPHVAGGFLLASVDRIVVNAELGLGPAGMYMVAVQISTAMLLVFDAVNKAYIPWLYERLQRDVMAEKRQIVRYTYLYFCIVLLMAAIAFLLGPFLIRLIAGGQYTAAGEVIGWLALGQSFCGMYFMVTNYIFYSKRTAMLSLATITSGLLNVGLLLVLIEPLGLTGAAQAFCIAMAVRFLLTWVVAQKRHPMPWFDFKPQQ